MVALQEDRRYVLTIGDYQSGDGVQITDLQITFNVPKSSDNKRTSNTATIEVYNLARKTLGKLETEFLVCELAVGYRDTGTQVIISGNVVTTETIKKGTDQVTTFTLGEGYVSLNHQRVNTLVAPGKVVQDIIEEIRQKMPGVAKGAYTGPSLSLVIPYGYPLNGSPRAMLDRLAREHKFEWRVDNNALYVTDENGLSSKDTADAPVISQATGLIDTPYYVSGDSKKLDTDPRRRTGVKFKALLNPGVVPGGIIKLESTTLPALNGFYRVNDVTFSGSFRGGDWVMECLCSQIFNVELAV